MMQQRADENNKRFLSIFNLRGRILSMIHEIEPLLRSHILFVADFDWIGTCSCCQGHAPNYRGYIYYRVLPEYRQHLEEILVSVVQNLQCEDIMFSKLIEYKLKKSGEYYILKFPTSMIDDVTKLVEERISDLVIQSS